MKVSYDDANLLRVYGICLIALLSIFSFSTIAFYPDSSSIYFRLIMLWSIIVFSFILYIGLLIYANNKRKASFTVRHNVKCKVVLGETVIKWKSASCMAVAGDEGNMDSSPDYPRDAYVRYWIRFWNNLEASRCKEISIPVTGKLNLMDNLEIAIWTLSKSHVQNASITFIVDRSREAEIDFFGLRFLRR